MNGWEYWLYGMVDYIYILVTFKQNTLENICTYVIVTNIFYSQTEKACVNFIFDIVIAVIH